MPNNDERKAAEALLDRTEMKVDRVHAKMVQINTEAETLKAAIDGLQNPIGLQRILELHDSLGASLESVGDCLQGAMNASTDLPSAEYLEDVIDEFDRLDNTLAEVNQAIQHLSVRLRGGDVSWRKPRSKGN